jgi:hypothetical protein
MCIERGEENKKKINHKVSELFTYTHKITNTGPLFKRRSNNVVYGIKNGMKNGYKNR